jgi:hypothetical protein
MKQLFPSLILLFCCSLASNLQSQDVALAQGEKMMQNHQAAFEENKGQITGDDAAKVNFVYKDKALSIFLLKTGIAYQFNQTHYPEGYKHLDKFAQPEEREKMDELRKDIRVETYRMDIELLGANPNPRTTTEGKSQDYTQYYNHNALNVHNYSKITYHEVYPNIDWVIYKTDKALKYDFVVRTGGNPAQIQLKTHWVEDLQLNEDGGITLKNRMGSITEQSPVSFQADKAISTQFKLENNVLSFAVANYDPNQTLIIDPTLIWATYYGGTSADGGLASTVDAAGNVYLAGRSESTNNIAAGGHQNANAGGNNDAILVKFNSSGVRQWATYYGSSGDDAAYACTAEANGNIYLTGSTNSNTNIAFGGYQNTYGGNGNSDAFLVKFNSSGVRQWATYYGGTGNEAGNSCPVDASGNVYLTSSTSSTGMAFNGYQNTSSGGNDALLVKFSSTGLRLWATYYGGNLSETSRTCSVDGNGNVYIAGRTQSITGIASVGHQNVYAGGLYDVFLAKFDSNGALQWATYYGGTDTEDVHGSAVDASGNVYITGYSSSTIGIASSGHQNAWAGGRDAFLVKFNSAGIRQWATYYGDTNAEEGYYCTTDASDNIYLAGYTSSTINIASGGHQNTYGGGTKDAFLVKFNSAGTRQWASYYGGIDVEDAWSCAADASGNVYLIGTTKSTTNIASGGHQNIYGGGTLDAFLAKFAGSPCTPTTSTITQASCTSFTLNGTTYTSSGTYTQNRTNAAGCDSIITLNLTINQPTTATITQASCTNFTLNGTTYTSSGIYTQNRTNAAGCDSIITLNLTINQPTTATITQASCTNFTLNGTTYTSSGTYTQNRSNAAGCDSVITLNLTINALPSVSITQSSTTLQATAGYTAYVWSLNGTIISGATNSSHTATTNGDYQITITDANGCQNTASINYTASNIGEISPADFVKIFPNPSEGIVNINFSQSGAKTINIYDNLGRLVYQNHFDQLQNQIFIQDLPSGVYQVQIIQVNAQITKSLIIAK